MAPDWAIERAKDVLKQADPGCDLWLAAWIIECFAHYIASHEQPPVDPLLIEARGIVAQIGRDRGYQPYWIADVACGRMDDHEYVIGALAALKARSK